MNIDFESYLNHRILLANTFSDVMLIPRCIKCGSYEMVIDATQEMAEGVMCLNHCGLNPDMPVITKKTMLPRMARIKYYCKNCGARMETTTMTIPEGYQQWNRAWHDEETSKKREIFAQALKHARELKESVQNAFIMNEALRTKTTLKLTREEAIRAGFIHVFVPRKQTAWRFRKGWKRK